MKLPELEQAKKDGACSERERVAAIIRSPAADGRYRQALALALHTDMTADAAIALLMTKPLDTPVDGAAPDTATVFTPPKTGDKAAEDAWARAIKRMN